MRQYVMYAVCLCAGLVGGVLANMAVNPVQSQVVSDPRALLEGKTGSELDRAYVEAMIEHHETGIDLSQAVLANSEDESVRYQAAEVVTVESDELSLLREWLAKWYSQDSSINE